MLCEVLSPVIGVILMVAITVILAAVIASFVLGLGDQGDPAPTPTIQSDYSSNELAFGVTGGDDFTAADSEMEFELTVEGEDDDGNTATADLSGSVSLDGDGTGATVSVDSTDPDADDFDTSAISVSINSDGDQITAGDDITITLNGADAFTDSSASSASYDADGISGWEAEIIWNPADSESSVIYSDSS